jgi:hypothetical protein
MKLNMDLRGCHKKASLHISSHLRHYHQRESVKLRHHCERVGTGMMYCHRRACTDQRHYHQRAGTTISRCWRRASTNKRHCHKRASISMLKPRAKISLAGCHKN